MKKTGLGKDPLKWIKTTTTEELQPEVRKKKKITQTGKSENIPKFKTFDVRLTVLLREDQLDFLEKLVREIQKNREPEYREERITKNTLIRVFIDAFRKVKLNTRNIPDEETLLQRALECLRE